MKHDHGQKLGALLDLSVPYWSGCSVKLPSRFGLPNLSNSFSPLLVGVLSETVSALGRIVGAELPLSVPYWSGCSVKLTAWRGGAATLGAFSPLLVGVLSETRRG